MGGRRNALYVDIQMSTFETWSYLRPRGYFVERFGVRSCEALQVPGPLFPSLCIKDTRVGGDVLSQAVSCR
jgi:hypothetical protein